MGRRKEGGLSGGMGEGRGGGKGREGGGEEEEVYAVSSRPQMALACFPCRLRSDQDQRLSMTVWPD